MQEGPKEVEAGPMMNGQQESQAVNCPGRIAAVREVRNGGGGYKLGGLEQIEAGVPLEICGEGYSAVTVRVRWQESTFFVFRQDLGHEL